jgi:hypothetical protein
MILKIAIKLISKSWVDGNTYTLTDEEIIKMQFFKE